MASKQEACTLSVCPSPAGPTLSFDKQDGCVSIGRGFGFPRRCIFLLFLFFFSLKQKFQKRIGILTKETSIFAAYKRKTLHFKFQFPLTNLI